jgi:hypothetical protein
MRKSSLSLILLTSTFTLGVAAACDSSDDDDGSTVDGGAGSAGEATGGGAGTGGSGGSGGSLATGGSSGSGGSGGVSCGEFGDSADCQACLQDNCCTEGGRCERSAECTALVTCVADCADADNVTSCRGECLTQHPIGAEPYNLLLLCMGGEACNSRCQSL